MDNRHPAVINCVKKEEVNKAALIQVHKILKTVQPGDSEVLYDKNSSI